MRTHFFFSSRRRHTRLVNDWSSDVCSSDLRSPAVEHPAVAQAVRTHEPADPVAGRLARGRLIPAGGRRPGADGALSIEQPLNRLSRLERSEERRVGKECSCGWATEWKQKKH